jgi:hypothetical protein
VCHGWKSPTVLNRLALLDFSSRGAHNFEGVGVLRAFARIMKSDSLKQMSPKIADQVAKNN